jgi:hypothetical protein
MVTIKARNLVKFVRKASLELGEGKERHHLGGKILFDLSNGFMQNPLIIH